MFNQNSADCVRSVCHISCFAESRPLSIPMKVMTDTTAEESWATSEERMKELIGHVWDAVKRLTVQVLNYTILLLMCLYAGPSAQVALFPLLVDFWIFYIVAHCIHIIAVRFFEICHQHHF